MKHFAVLFIFLFIIWPIVSGQEIPEIPACTPGVTISIVEPIADVPVGPSSIPFTANFTGTTDVSDLTITINDVVISESGSITLEGQTVKIEKFTVMAPVVSFLTFGLPFGEHTFAISLGGAQVETKFTVSMAIAPWEQSFYVVNYLGSAKNGLLIRYDVDKPLTEPVITNSVNINGAIGLDRVKGVIYGGMYSTDNAPIRAFDAMMLDPKPDKDIKNIKHSGSLAIEVDVRKRVLYLLDTPTRKFTAINISDSNYGAVLATKVVTELKTSSDTDIGDFFAVDHSQSKIFATNGNGGSIVAIDISDIDPAGGSFGSVEKTNQTARSTGNSGGMIAIDEISSRVFTLINNNTIRAFSSKAPYTTLKDYKITVNVPNDCGIWYDWRMDNLYVGLGSAQKILVLSLADSKSSFYTLPAPHGHDGISLAGPAPY